MKIRARSILMTLFMACLGGCMVETDPGDPVSTTEEERSTGLEPVATNLGPTASAEDFAFPPKDTFCFTCVLDPSITACGSPGSNALYRCERACVVCDEFGDNQGQCFRGPCYLD